jgi:tetratricopeptide (TPR) repeat protein
MRAANGAGVLAGEQGDFPAARGHFEESLELARAAGERDREARAGSNLGILAMYEGDFETAIRRYEEATVIAREEGDERTISLSLQNLGLAHEGAGNLDHAVILLEESMAIARRAKDPAHIASTQRGLARLLLDSDPARANALLRESLARSRELADANAIVTCLETASALADPPTGALLWGAAGALRAEAGATRQPDEVTFAARVEAALNAALGPQAFAAGVAEGASLLQTEAVELAIGT